MLCIVFADPDMLHVALNMTVMNATDELNAEAALVQKNYSTVNEKKEYQQAKN